MAYEHLWGKPRYFVDYVVFMDKLINTGKDVELLRKSGIVFDNWLRDDEEVTKIFNKLGYFVYYDIGARMNKHCKTKWNIWKAKLKIILTLPGRPYHFLLHHCHPFLVLWIDDQGVDFCYIGVFEFQPALGDCSLK
ncbi:hypothetical protein Goarm_022494, partial [Gossypium armourianum]|nr:hypothetical protein [Gossypium armourianum]